MTTERELLDLLHLRHSAVNPGNGPRYVCAEHVKNQSGFGATRQLDMIVMDLWPSSGNALHGFEVKTSRGDFLREIADREKSGAFRPYLDYWWLVVPDSAMVRSDLPPGWGLMSPTRDDSLLRVRVGAPRQNAPQPMPRGMQACLLRAAAVTARRRARPLAVTP